MTSPAPKVLAFAGSLRKASYNRKLIALATERARALGAEVDLLDLTDVTMPLYDGDLEAASGLPPGAVEFRRRIAAATALIIASPEYNSSIPGPLKNAIDWASRPPNQPWAGKIALLMSASPSPFGGARGLPDLRKVLCSVSALVLPVQVHIARTHEAFDEAGKLKLDLTVKSLENAVGELINIARKLSAS
jgi:chromate reductase, NAD(P)H dehydrogenase (quinone)